MEHPETPLGGIIQGSVAGAAGTAVMDAVLYYRYRRGGGENGFVAWEFEGADKWSSVSAPGKVGKRLVEGFTQHRLSPRWARLTNNVMHWGFGIFWGGVYGMVAGSLRAPRIGYGLPFGAGVWLFGYAVLPLGHLYKPIWKYSLDALAKDLGAHLWYGAAVATTFRLLRKTYRP